MNLEPNIYIRQIRSRDHRVHLPLSIWLSRSDKITWGIQANKCIVWTTIMLNSVNSAKRNFWKHLVQVESYLIKKKLLNTVIMIYKQSFKRWNMQNGCHQFNTNFNLDSRDFFIGQMTKSFELALKDHNSDLYTKFEQNPTSISMRCLLRKF